MIRITAKDNTEACYCAILNYLCELLEEEDFPRSYAVEFRGPEKKYLPITGLPKKGIHQLCACAVEYPSLHSLLERYARLAMRQYESYTNLNDEQSGLPGSFAVFALGMQGEAWRQLVWDYLDLCDDEHARLQEKFLRAYVKRNGFTEETVPIFVRGVLSMQNMRHSKDYAAWVSNARSLDALIDAKIHLQEIVPSGFSSDEDDDDEEQCNETPEDKEASVSNARSLDALIDAKIHLQEIVPSGFSSDEDDDDEEQCNETPEDKEASFEEVLQYAWETVCFVIWGKGSAKCGQKILAGAPEALQHRFEAIFSRFC